MADQSVRVTNLPDSGSPCRIAYELMARISNGESAEKKADIRQYHLQLYKECRESVY
jgi:hypothetical protein